VALSVAEVAVQVIPVPPEQVKLTVPAKPPVPVTVTGYVVELPAVTVAVPLGGPTVKLGALTAPAKACTRLKALKEPSPVTRSYPVPALNPVKMPLASAPLVVLQLCVPVRQGSTFVPLLTS